jgi:hypothetical protein
MRPDPGQPESPTDSLASLPVLRVCCEIRVCYENGADAGRGKTRRQRVVGLGFRRPKPAGIISSLASPARKVRLASPLAVLRLAWEFDQPGCFEQPG